MKGSKGYWTQFAPRHNGLSSPIAGEQIGVRP